METEAAVHDREQNASRIVNRERRIAAKKTRKKAARKTRKKVAQKSSKATKKAARKKATRKGVPKKATRKKPRGRGPKPPRRR